ncbi:NAD-dependent epimerase/dehydratase family protein [Nocardia terpenica]|nr:NAD-dependent epimerase/dehydratase family protein [Nocardia terpenica]NQE87540.1 UDP-glucose 4-epimerase [Nocardia terpenica]
MRVLVTGANGYVGRAVVAALSASGHDPVAMVRRGGPVSDAREVRVADLLDDAALRQAVAGVDAVCHLAGLTRARESISEPLRYFRVNTAGTIALLDAMNWAGVQKLVFASTGSIYGTPDRQPMSEKLPDAPPHPYASSKLAAEMGIEAQCRAGHLAAGIIRMLNVAGGADPDPTRLVPRALAAAAGQSVLAINGPGTAVRDYLHITDAADAFVASLEHLPAVGKAERYNIGSGSGKSVLDVVAAVERVTGRRVPLEHRPPAAEPIALISNSSKARSEIFWTPKHSDIDEIVRDAWRTSFVAR